MGDVLGDTPVDADSVAERLSKLGVDTVVVAVVDPAGITRIKAIPLSRLGAATLSGVGFSRALSVMCVYDLPASVPGLEAPIGDLRLIPDLETCVPLAAQPGLAWVAADQYDQDGTEWPACPRRFLRRMLARLAAEGVALNVGYEFEWFQGQRGDTDDAAPLPAHRGPGYSAIALTAGGAPLTLLRALYEQRVLIEQFHPELAPGQFELSTRPLPAMQAADTNLLVRQTIRGAARSLGQEPSFAPVAIAGGIGNGAHLHFSLVDDAGRNQLCDGEGACGMTPRGEAFVAGVLQELPALAAITTPSPGSYLRLQPQRWAGAYQAWGPENREAALRFITGMAGDRRASTNVEYKPIDHAANPYLALGAIVAAGLAGVHAGRSLPQPVVVDPATLTDDDRRARGINRLPGSLDAAIDKLESSEVLTEAMGDLLLTSFAATRRAEADMYRSASDVELVQALRWRY